MHFSNSIIPNPGLQLLIPFSWLERRMLALVWICATKASLASNQSPGDGALAKVCSCHIITVKLNSLSRVSSSWLQSSCVLLRAGQLVGQQSFCVITRLSGRHLCSDCARLNVANFGTPALNSGAREITNERL